MKPRHADWLLVAATFIWGSSFVIVKGALAASPPLTFLAIRFALAAVALTPWTRLRPFPRGAELRAGLVLAICLALGFAATTIGLDYTTPSRSAFIVASSSVLAPVVAFVALRQRPGAAVAVALLTAGVGMYLLTDPGGGGLNRGDVWTLATAVTFGAQIVAVGEFSRRFDAARLVWMQTAGTAVAAALVAPLVETPHVAWSAGFAAALGWCGVLATAVALRWQMRAQREMSSARAALLFCCEPVFAALTSWLATGERLSAAQWAGGALILAGMVVAELPGVYSARLPE